MGWGNALVKGVHKVSLTLTLTLALTLTLTLTRCPRPVRGRASAAP